MHFHSLIELYVSLSSNCDYVFCTAIKKILDLTWNAAGEDEDTQDVCVALVKDKLGIADASMSDFAGFHRLSWKENSGNIVRFRDLGMRNRCLASAKNLRGLADDISISPDVPPVLPTIKTELLTKRKSLSLDENKKVHLEYLRQWPYIVLDVGKVKTIKPATTTKTVINSILGFSPLMTFARDHSSFFSSFVDYTRSTEARWK